MMTKFSRLVFFLLVSLSAKTLICEADDGLDVQDIQALRDWINMKRQVTVKELGGNLSISGEVRFEFQSTNEWNNGKRQRGQNGITVSGKKFPSRAYDVELNLMFDYKADNTWAAVRVEFDNDAGFFSGTTDRVKLEKAYFGARVYDGDLYTMNIEMGRRPLNTCFESKVEFGSLSDGAFWRNDWSVDEYGDLYLHILGEIVNDVKNQYALFAEMGWMGVMDSGLYFKYSIADWRMKSGPQYRFIVNQWLFAYKWIPQPLGKLVKPYIAFLWNPVAKREAIFTDNKLENMGGYFGFTLGELRKEGDWSLDANYQYVEAQVLPGYDSSGIGLGNAAGGGLYTDKANEQGAPLTTTGKGTGRTNFQGYMLTLDYLLTANLNFQQQWVQSFSLNNHIGPRRKYKQYEIEFIYGF